MADARLAYLQSRLTSMTRIDMLLAIYHRTMDCLDAGLAALQNADSAEFHREQLRANQLLLALLDGIDVGQGEVAVNVQRIYHHCIGLVWSRQPEQWQATQRILQPLLNSFTSIRDEAVAQELSGVIPPLNTQTTWHQATA